MNAKTLNNVETTLVTALTHEAAALDRIGTAALTVAMERVQEAGVAAVVRLQTAKKLLASLESDVLDELNGFLADLSEPPARIDLGIVPALTTNEGSIDLSVDPVMADDEPPPAHPNEPTIDLASVPTTNKRRSRTKK